MWNKPWTLKEGLVIGGGLAITGLMLQLAVGPIDWDILAWPANIIVLILYLAVLALIYAKRGKVYLFDWLTHYQAAVSSLIWAAALTLVMGLTPQTVTMTEGEGSIPGLSQMLTFWPFVLIYIFMTTVVGLVALQRIVNFRRGNIGSILNHLGVFVVLVSATLGSADMQRLDMTVQMGSAEWRALDRTGNIVELPVAIELQEFTIDEYPPKLMLVDNASGKVLPMGKPVHILLDDATGKGSLLDWTITVERKIELAAEVASSDTVNYVEWPSMGATYAALVKAENVRTHTVKRGWVSCGSFAFPYKALKLDETCSLVMPDREPRRYASKVHVYTEAGASFDGTIEVNKPLNVEGWKIYQLSYDETKGRWSDISVFELVTDPWLPVVYTGIIMMFVGAIFTFTLSRTRKEKKQ